MRGKQAFSRYIVARDGEALKIRLIVSQLGDALGIDLVRFSVAHRRFHVFLRDDWVHAIDAIPGLTQTESYNTKLTEPFGALHLAYNLWL